MDKESHICKSCTNEFTGAYCNSCGEKIIRQEDRKLIYFFGELVNALSFADNRLWRTLKSIHLYPGRFSRDFVDGKRKKYMKPVSIFFLANLIYFLLPLFNTFTTNLNIQLIAFFYSDLATSMVEQQLLVREMTMQEFQLLYDDQTEELSKLLLILMSGLLALFFWPIHIGRKKFLIADHLVFGLETMVFMLLFCLMFLIIFLGLFSLVNLELISDSSLTLLGLISLIYFFYRAERTFYGFKGIRRIINTLLCVTAVAASLSLYRAILFFVTFWSI